MHFPHLCLITPATVHVFGCVFYIFLYSYAGSEKLYAGSEKLVRLLFFLRPSWTIFVIAVSKNLARALLYIGPHFGGVVWQVSLPYKRTKERTFITLPTGAEGDTSIRPLAENTLNVCDFYNLDLIDVSL